MNPVLFIVIPWFTAFFVMMLFPYLKKISGYFLAGSGIFSLIFSIFISREFYSKGVQSFSMGSWPAPFGINLVLDKASIFFLLIFNIVFLAVVLINLFEKKYFPYFNLIILVFQGAFSGLVLTGDLFNLFIFMEIASISMTALVNRSSQKGSSEGSYNYLILSAAVSLFFLLGIGFLYSSTGTLNLIDIFNKSSSIPKEILSFLPVFFIIPFALESELFPLNGWVPSFYSKGDYAVSGFLSGISGPVFLFLVLKLSLWIFPAGELSVPLLILGIITLISGELSALVQKGLLKMLAFSSIGSMGLAMILVSQGTVKSVGALIFFLFSLILSKIPLFFVSNYLKGKYFTDRIAELKGIFRIEKLAGIIFAVSAFSLVGIPIFAGFRAKLYVFNALSEINVLLIIPVVLVIAVEFSYFFNAVQKLFFLDSEKTVLPVEKKQITRMYLYISLLFALGLFVFGFFPEGISKIAEEAAKQITNPSLYVTTVLGGM